MMLLPPFVFLLSLRPTVDWTKQGVGIELGILGLFSRSSWKEADTFAGIWANGSPEMPLGRISLRVNQRLVSMSIA